MCNITFSTLGRRIDRYSLLVLELRVLRMEYSVVLRTWEWNYVCSRELSTVAM